jgi:lysine biosynthesis protein LysW
MAKCPACSAQTNLGPNPRPYQLVKCPECEIELEIIKINLPILDWAVEGDEEPFENLDFDQYQKLGERECFFS